MARAALKRLNFLNLLIKILFMILRSYADYLRLTFRSDKVILLHFVMVLKQTIRHLIQQPILMVFLLFCQLYASAWWDHALGWRWELLNYNLAAEDFRLNSNKFFKFLSQLWDYYLCNVQLWLLVSRFRSRFQRNLITRFLWNEKLVFGCKDCDFVSSMFLLTVYAYFFSGNSQILGNHVPIVSIII